MQVKCTEWLNQIWVELLNGARGKGGHIRGMMKQNLSEVKQIQFPLFYLIVNITGRATFWRKPIEIEQSIPKIWGVEDLQKQEESKNIISFAWLYLKFNIANFRLSWLDQIAYIDQGRWIVREQFSYTHPDSSDRLCRAHVRQYHQGYCELEYFEGTQQLLWHEYRACSSCSIPSEVPSMVL